MKIKKEKIEDFLLNGINYETFCTFCNICRGTLISVLKNNRSHNFKTIKKIADVLNIPPQDLVIR